MNTLTTIESNVLNNPNVLAGLNVAGIKEAIKLDKESAQGSVNRTFQTARLLHSATEYFKSKECKQIRDTEGLTWKLEDFFKYAGFPSKSWAYLLLKAVKLEFKTITNEATGKQTKVDVLKAYLNSEQEKSYSMEKFVLYATDKPAVVKVEKKLTLTFGDSKLSISDKNELTTKMTASQIKAVITLLIAQVEILDRK